MMKFYLFIGIYGFDRDKISKILVQDFLTLKAIDAKSAFYVIGSNIKGPMGWDLIPFEKIDTTRQFLKKHEGKKIVRFQDSPHK